MYPSLAQTPALIVVQMYLALSNGVDFPESARGEPHIRPHQFYFSLILTVEAMAAANQDALLLWRSRCVKPNPSFASP